MIEYRLVYKHGNKLPKPDGFNKFLEENEYKERYVIENSISSKVKDYKDNIQDYSEIFKIKHVALDKRSELEGTEHAIEYFKEVHCVYNAKSVSQGSKGNAQIS